MGIIYAAALRTTRITAVKTAIDAGAAAGYVEICSAAYAAVLATITLADPCGTVSGDVLTFTIPRSDSAADNTGTAAIARIKDSDANIIVSGLTVGTSGANINFATVSFVAGQIVTLTSFTLTHPST